MMNGNNNNNSTITTNTNTIGVEDIEKIYHGGLGGQQSIYECFNKNCDKKQTKKGMKFKHCSRCQGVMYCSKECQKEDWRAKHKLECIPTIGLKAVEPPDGTPEQRVGQFRELYEPMLTQIIIHMLMDGTDIHTDLLCETHVCMITLEDLPPSNSQSFFLGCKFSFKYCTSLSIRCLLLILVLSSISVIYTIVLLHLVFCHHLRRVVEHDTRSFWSTISFYSWM